MKTTDFFAAPPSSRSSVSPFHWPADCLPKAPIIVPLDHLRPTQVAVGMRAVAAKREKVEHRAQKQKKIVRFLEERPIPAVRGPGNAFYIIDHHHLSLALCQSQVRSAFVEVVGDFSSFSAVRFWRRMESEGWVYPFDEKGNRVHPATIPSAIPALKADHYRDLAWSVREAGGYKKTRAPYAEFRWADFFRQRITLSSVRRDYETSVEVAMKLARSPAAAHLPGHRSR